MVKITKRVCKFEVQELLPLALTLIVTGIGIAYGISVLGDIRTDAFNSAGATCNSTDPTGCGSSYNASTQVIKGVSKIPEKLPLIVTVVVAAVIIGILIRYLMVRFD